MIHVDYIKISPAAADKLKISWEFQQTIDDFQDYFFTLERSEDPKTGFHPVFTFNHDVEYIDTVYYKKIWRDIFYRIISKNVKTGEEEISDSYRMQVAPDLEALEIIRRNKILLENKRHGTGMPAAIFKLKTVGPKCEHCWDKHKQNVRVSSCPFCYKTGTMGGYYEPIIVWMNFTPPMKLIQLPQWGEMEPKEERIFMNNEPSVNPKDIIFESSSMEMKLVERVETSTRRGFVLHQIVSVSILPRGDISYDLLKEYPNLVDKLQEERNKIKTS